VVLSDISEASLETCMILLNGVELLIFRLAFFVKLVHITIHIILVCLQTCPAVGLIYVWSL
jgi:hypothetical protein